MIPYRSPDWREIIAEGVGIVLAALAIGAGAWGFVWLAGLAE